MRIPIHIAQKLLHLSKGEMLSSSAAKHTLIEELVAEGIIERTGRIQKKLKLINAEALLLILQSKYGINDLQKYIELVEKENLQRSDLVEVSSNSKLKSIRTFQGFLINSYMPIQATWQGNETTFNFTEGIFQFIYDYERFIPDHDITIIGIENPESFRWIAKQSYLFSDIKPLFVSRYPQNQSKDLLRWLMSIPNNYLHFGDFDIAGIGIYLNEFKKHLLEKASFFVPENIEDEIIQYGNKNRYNQQKVTFDINSINEDKLINLLKILRQHKKGLDQEIFIQRDIGNR